VTFIYDRTVRFQDTDAAGVVYFANVLAICHEAYEASLEAAGFELKTFFGQSNLALPIVHASVDFLKPMFCGDRLQIHLTAQCLHETRFEIAYQLYHTKAPETLLSKAVTRHACVQVGKQSRQCVPLPPTMRQWLDAIG
jgi:1,4-dihydroxy-2-naphthoyl-CoA hydrolase